MSNTANELPVLNTSEWLDPETFEKMVRLGPSLVSSFSKLKTMLSKGGGSKRDLKKLGAEIDDLRKDLETVCGLISKSIKSHQKFVEAVAGLVATGGGLVKFISFAKAVAENTTKITTIVLAHEARLKALEASVAEAKNKRGNGKKSISSTSAKTRKKPKGNRSR